MKTFNVLILSISVLLSAFAKADLCQINAHDKQAIENAIIILNANYDLSSPIRLYMASIQEAFPGYNWNDPTKKGEIRMVSGIRLDDRSPFFHLKASGWWVPYIDLGYAYYFDQKTQKWTNLGRAAQCKGIAHFLLKAGEAPLTLEVAE